MKKLSLLVMVVLALVGCERKVEKGKQTFFFEMYDSIPYDSFDENPMAHDKKTLREPVKGTIPRGFKPYHYKKTPQDAERAGKELRNPLPSNPVNLAQGKELYNTFCFVCHGVYGKGDGPVIPKFPPPQPFNSDYMKGLSEGRVFHVITVGSYLMGSYASQISPKERWQIVQYVKTLQRRKD